MGHIIITDDKELNQGIRPPTIRIDGSMADQGNVPRNTMLDTQIVSCWCKKSFKSVRGLKIYQTRKGCRLTASSVPEPSVVMQHSGADLPPGNASDDNSPVNNHNAADESIADPPGARRKPIKWPSMSHFSTWSAMDDDLSVVLQLR